MASITLTNAALTPSTVTVYCSSVSYSIRKNNYVQPIENGTNMAYVQTNSFDNPMITLNNVIITNTTNTLSMSNVLELLSHQYDGSNPILLDLDYGKKGVTYGLPKWTPTGIYQTAVSVILDSANFNISAQDSKEGYMPIGTITFVQTR
jgi:hypothetical protein